MQNNENKQWLTVGFSSPPNVVLYIFETAKMITPFCCLLQVFYSQVTNTTSLTTITQILYISEKVYKSYEFREILNTFIFWCILQSTHSALIWPDMEIYWPDPDPVPSASSSESVSLLSGGPRRACSLHGSGCLGRYWRRKKIAMIVADKRMKTPTNTDIKIIVRFWFVEVSVGAKTHKNMQLLH